MAKSVRTLKVYRQQRKNAHQRGIPFKLTFEQWLTIWKESGKLQNRGRGMGHYCMARFGDRGAYEVGNVHIITHQQNSSDYVTTPQRCAAISKAFKGKPKSKTHRAAMSWAWRTRLPFSEESKQKMSRSARLRVKRVPEQMKKVRAARKNFKYTPEHLAKLSRAAKRRHKLGTLGFTGRRHTNETRAKMQSNWRNQYAD
jgi:hypothetical protein